MLSQMVRHATETPKLLRELAPAAPEGLQQVVNSLLAKDPAQRFATPERTAKALQPFLGAATPARTSEEGPQLKKYLTWLEKNAEVKPPEPPPAEPAAAMPLALKPPIKVPPTMAAPVAAPAPRRAPARDD